MSRAVGIFCNTNYFPIAVPVINSFFYNDVQAKIKVYDHSGLNHLLRTYLAKFADVVSLADRSVIDDRWMFGCQFRPRMLTQVGFDDAELFLDTDMVALSDLEWPLRLIESGKFVGSTEWVWGPGEVEKSVAEQWTKMVGAPPPKKFNVFNGGLLGLNFSKHYTLTRRWADICRNRRIYDKLPFNNDQMVISGMLECLNIVKQNLPRRYWMTTWHGHNQPPKLLGFNEDSKLRLYDSETGKPIQLYHYTGGIDQKVGEQSRIIRYFHARAESIMEPRELSAGYKAAWKSLWEGRYRSPAGMVAEYMRDAGPVQIPRVFSTDFRDRVETLLSGLQYDPEGKRVYAVCIAYDYLTLLGYRLGGECWLEKPLRALLGDKITQGDKVLKWDEPADITLSFGGQTSPHLWVGNAFSDPGQVEHLNGVNIRLN